MFGDPIVNISFGAGNNPGGPLNAATTSYTYFASDCPDDGFYSVRNNTSNCFSTSWHSMSVDHTGNPGGYFMLVNASIQPSAFYVDTVRGLCANTRFEFAAWVANVLRPSACNGSGIEPNLTFTIERTDGSILQTYSTGLINQTVSLQWRQYGFFFTTPPGVSDVVLRIFNNSRGGCGNDLALDDITFRPCGPLLQSGVEGFANDTINYCEASPVLFCYARRCRQVSVIRPSSGSKVMTDSRGRISPGRYPNNMVLRLPQPRLPEGIISVLLRRNRKIFPL